MIDDLETQFKEFARRVNEMAAPRLATANAQLKQRYYGAEELDFEGRPAAATAGTVYSDVRKLAENFLAAQVDTPELRTLLGKPPQLSEQEGGLETVNNIICNTYKVTLAHLNYCKPEVTSESLGKIFPQYVANVRVLQAILPVSDQAGSGSAAYP